MHIILILVSIFTVIAIIGFGLQLLAAIARLAFWIVAAAFWGIALVLLFVAGGLAYAALTVVSYLAGAGSKFCQAIHDGAEAEERRQALSKEADQALKDLATVADATRDGPACPTATLIKFPERQVRPSNTTVH